MEDAPPKKKRPTLITPVGGTHHWAPPEQFGMPDLDYLPPDYPRDLFPITRQILREAAEKFEEGRRLVPLCSYVIERLTPFFVSAAKNHVIRSHRVTECIRELVRLTLIASDCKGWYSPLQQVEASKEWAKLDRAMAEATMPSRETASDTTAKQSPESRAAADSNAGAPGEHRRGACSAKDMALKASDDCCSITVGETTYALTELAGKIVRELYERKRPLSKREIKRAASCGRVRDAFRKRDGMKFWEEQIRKPNKDTYELKIFATECRGESS